jgi:uncharacterized protein DUF4238
MVAPGIEHEPDLGPKPKSHHYVHRAYLEGFVDPETRKRGEGYLWAYMPGKSPFKQRPERVAKRNYYYCLQEGDDGKRDFRVEEVLGKLEDAALPILHRFRDHEFDLSADDKLTFAGYIALAFTRVPSFERSVNAHHNFMMAKAIKVAAQHDDFMEQAAREHSEETGETITAQEFRRRLTAGNVELKQTNRGWTIKVMFEAMLGLQIGISNMHWSFLSAPAGDPGFLTTDNPVSRYDPNNKPGRGIGFASSRDAHFAFPISRKLCLLAQHRPAPVLQQLSSSGVRKVYSANITRCDKQVYAPFNSLKIQTILDEVVREQRHSGRVFVRKGRVVRE